MPQNSIKWKLKISINPNSGIIPSFDGIRKIVPIQDFSQQAITRKSKGFNLDNPGYTRQDYQIMQ